MIDDLISTEVKYQAFFDQDVNALLHSSLWEITDQNAFRLFINKKSPLLKQGWKIHISCQSFEITRLLETIIPVLSAANVSFKVLSTLDQIVRCNSGEGGLSQIGKIITIYPNDTIQAFELGKKIDEIWNLSNAPIIPSDIFFRSKGNVSLRFGVFNNTQYVLDDAENLKPALINPMGQLVPDVSSLNGGQVTWAPTLPVQLARHEYMGQEIEHLQKVQNGRYCPLSVFTRRSFLISLVCLDELTKKGVLVKIYHKRSGADLNGHTFWDKALNEYSIASVLAAGNICPRIIEKHEDEHFYYVVFEYIQGVAYSELDRQERVSNLKKLFHAVQAMHDLNIVHRDLKLSNVLVNKDRLFLIDFEISSIVGTKHPFLGGTESYIPPEGSSSPARPSYDSYALGNCIIHAYTGIDPAVLPVDIETRLTLISAYVPRKTALLIRKLYDEDESKRPGAAECIAYISLPPKQVFTSAAKHKKGLDQIPGLLGNGLSLLTNLSTSENDIGWESTHTASRPDFKLGLNTGIGGHLLGLLAITQALDVSDDYFKIVENAINTIVETVRTGDNSPGLFTGISGAALAIGNAYQTFKKQEWLELSYTLLNDASKTDCSYDYFSGYAGIAFAAMKIFQSTGQDRFLSIAEKCITIIDSKKELIKNVTAWATNKNQINPKYETGIAHGTAGIAFSIALYAAIKKSAYHRQVAINCFKEIYLYARNADKGYLHQNLANVRQPTYNKNWCHGTAGYLWAIAQLPEIFDDLEEEIKWALAACTQNSHLSNPTYCHGLAGSLELWRIINSTILSNKETDRLYKNTLNELINAAQSVACVKTFSSESPTVFSPDLWVGYTGAFSSLALEKIKSNTTILNTKW
jgi:hypothetical protein